MVFVSFAVAVAVAAVAPAVTVRAQGVPSPAPPVAVEPRTLVLGANLWPPFIEFDTAGRPWGRAYDDLSRVAAGLGLRLDVQPLPFPRAIAAAQANQLDGILLSAAAAARPGLDHAGPIACDDRVLLAHRRRAFNWQNRDELQGKIVAVGRGFFAGSLVQQWIREGVVVPLELSDTLVALDILARGRADAALLSGTEAATLSQLRPDLADQLMVLEPPVASMALSIAFSARGGGRAQADAFSREILRLGLGAHCS